MKQKVEQKRPWSLSQDGNSLLSEITEKKKDSIKTCCLKCAPEAQASLQPSWKVLSKLSHPTFTLQRHQI